MEKGNTFALLEKEEYFALLVGMQIGAATLKKGIEIPQKLNNRITLWASNAPTGYLPQEYKNTNLKR